MRLPRKRQALAGAILLASAGLAVAVTQSAYAATSTLTPTAITTSSGSTGGQPVGNLAVRDQSGTANGWNRYVEFEGRYSGYLTYAVPGSVTPGSVTAVQAQVNYRGPAAGTQAWTFKLYNWRTSAWVTLGTNAAAPDWGAWTLLTFNATGTPGDYVSSSNAMRLQLVSGNDDDAADIDYAALVLTTGTGGGDPVPPSTPAPATTAPPSGGLPAPVSCPDCWHPALRTSWNWVISHVPAAPYRNVQMYDIDGFNATAADVTALHDAGKKVVCYISVGSYEDWRPDEAQFPDAILGEPLDGWPGERWLDVRDVRKPGSALAQIMNARLDMCDRKGFDAVEFDNMDGYDNDSGFPLSASDQAYYNVILANGARSRGMSAVMKNDIPQIGQLLPYFDMALNEECNEYDECDAYRAFVSAGKPVFNAEYGSSTSFCANDNALNINGVRFALDLDDSVYNACR